MELQTNRLCVSLFVADCEFGGCVDEMDQTTSYLARVAWIVSTSSIHFHVAVAP